MVVSLIKKLKVNIRNMVKKSLPESIPLSVSFVSKEKRFKKGAPLCICPKGSMTVEAAVILPLLASFFAALLFFFRVMQVELVVQQALENTAERLSVAGYLQKEDNSATIIDLGVAKSMLLAELKDDENIERYVVGDVYGIILMGSTFSEDEIFLKANYQIEFPVGLLGNRSFWMHQQTCYRKWTGWKSKMPEEDEEIWVYIAETGNVYHKTSSCTYLNLSITSINASEIANLRNESGKKYRECEKCAENILPSRVYITNYGDRYHTDLNCSGIKRTVYKVLLSEVGKRGACTKCWE